MLTNLTQFQGPAPLYWLPTFFACRTDAPWQCRVIERIPFVGTKGVDCQFFSSACVPMDNANPGFINPKRLRKNWGVSTIKVSGCHYLEGLKNIKKLLPQPRHWRPRRSDVRRCARPSFWPRCHQCISVKCCWDALAWWCLGAWGTAPEIMDLLRDSPIFRPILFDSYDKCCDTFFFSMEWIGSGV